MAKKAFKSVKVKIGGTEYDTESGRASAGKDHTRVYMGDGDKRQYVKIPNDKLDAATRAGWTVKPASTTKRAAGGTKAAVSSSR